MPAIWPFNCSRRFRERFSALACSSSRCDGPPVAHGRMNARAPGSPTWDYCDFIVGRPTAPGRSQARHAPDFTSYTVTDDIGGGGGAAGALLNFPMSNFGAGGGGMMVAGYLGARGGWLRDAGGRTPPTTSPVALSRSAWRAGCLPGRQWRRRWRLQRAARWSRTLESIWPTRTCS